jgi:hypothetical protein
MTHSKVMLIIRRWWQRLQPFIEEYRRACVEDHQYWGMHRAEGELQALGCDCLATTKATGKSKECEGQ